MERKILHLGIRESEFGGGSPDVYITICDNEITIIEFDPEFENENYSWCVSGWEYEQFIGKPVSALMEFVHEYNNMDYGYRDPYMFVQEVKESPSWATAQYYKLSW